MCPIPTPGLGKVYRLAALVLLAACPSAPAAPSNDEAALFTPAGFTREGRPAVAQGPQAGRLDIVVRDARTGRPTCCRINVVGPDGNYYQPAADDLTPFALTGQWPKVGRGNREGKGPFRYYGRFFYSRGESTVAVPAGPVRVEVWKGFEYRPQTLTTDVPAGARRRVELTLEQPVAMADRGYYAGDPHIHLPRQTLHDDQVAFDLMEGEGIRFGTILAFNDPAGPYAGFMAQLQTPQQTLGAASVRERNGYALLSGQEYRSVFFGHLNLFLRPDLVFPGSRLNADDGPLYGHVGRDTQRQGGYAFYAHGGYAQSIYADFVQGDVNGVELLQFGEYRGIGLADWYRILNIGYRFPCTAACDYPACRKLGDAQTYVSLPGKPDFRAWLQGAAEGRSFVTTGPLLFLEVDGQRPGATLRKDGPGPHQVIAGVRVRSEVAPVTHLQLIVNGTVVHELTVPASQGQGNWIEFEQPVRLDRSGWIAARVFSTAPSGKPDADAHTNPVYIYLNGKAPFDQAALDALIQRLDKQLAIHAGRKFGEKSRVLDYFQQSRSILRRIGRAGGLPAEGLAAFLKKGAAEQTFDPSARSHTDAELKKFLRPVPPKAPAEALRTFDAVDGFRMELVANEPMVNSPVAAAFDEDGNLYVAEMRDYPYQPRPGTKPISRIRLLVDTDGDGVFDKSYVFADNLFGVGAVAPWKGGVFVAAPPDVWYLKDTKGDHHADVRRKVYTGFDSQNMQGMLNNFIWGLDHKIYGSTSVNGGLVRRLDRPAAPPVSVKGRDVRFDPVTGELESITGTAQFGNTFDDWGDRFLCTESQPLLHVVLPQHYLARNPYLPVPAAIKNLAPGPVRVYRTSPVERWRLIRSSRRIAFGERSADMPGASQNVVDAGAGVVVYRGGAFPPQYYGTVFTPDAQNNVVHHRALIPAGPTFESKRVEANADFLRSSDNWFRPVNLLNAPDGTLYCLDMSREVLESIHIPLDVLKYLDLRAGRDHGRIYRIAPPGFKYPGPPRLGQATTAELVHALESPHGWWRDTAHRLLYERQDRAAVAPLRTLLTRGRMPQSRLHALWSLDGLHALTDADLLAALGDPKPEIREHAVRLAEPRLNGSPPLLARVLALENDPSPRVTFQLAFTLGEVRDPRAAAALARLARRSVGDVWMRTAVLSSVANVADRMLVQLLQDKAFAASPAGTELAGQLAVVVGVRNRPAELGRVLDVLAGAAPGAVNPSLRQRLVLDLGEGLKRAGGRLGGIHVSAAADGLLADLFHRAEVTAADPKAAVAARQEAVRLLACAPFAQTRATLQALLDPHQPEGVQLAAVKALSDYAEPTVAGILLEQWTLYAPTVRSAVVGALLAREPWTVAFLTAAVEGRASAQQVEPARRELLLKHRNPAIARLARQVFASDVLNPRDQVIASYGDALKLHGDTVRGRLVFRRNCSVCHRVAGEGFEIGPNLTSSSFRDPAVLLVHILDPNRYVLPKYVQYQVVDHKGRTYTGVIAAETATSITLRRQENAEDVILRSEIDEMGSTGRSLMPEGLEKQISKPEMADLLAFLIREQATTPPALDIGTEPAQLVEPAR